MNGAAMTQYMPHGTCLLWNPQLLSLHVLSDAGIALAYFSIPCVLAYFVAQRKDLPFRGLFAMFGAFIIACGLTHIMAIWTIWHPAYWLDGGIKALTAAISLATAVVLAPLIPKALTLQSPAQLEERNVELEKRLAVRQQALLDAEERFASVCRALPQIVWTAVPAGAIDFFNERWCEYTGMTLEGTLGWNWETVIHPDDAKASLDEWLASIASGEPYEKQQRLRRGSDGQYRWHLSRGLPIRDASGNLVQWFGTTTDIHDQRVASEAAGRFAEQLLLNERLQDDIRGRERAEAALRASEERYRQVEESAPIGLALVTVAGAFTRVNPALCELLGYRQPELLLTSLEAITHPGDRTQSLAYLASLTDGSPVEAEVTERFVRQDGRILWVSLSGSLVRNEAGEPDYFIVQVQDIDDRKAAAEALQSARDAALAGTVAKSRFLANMSHEIRTPMHGIIGMTELLLLTPLTSEQSEFAEVVRDSGRTLLRVLNDILDYSKIEAGKLELETTEFQLADVVESVVELQQAQFAGKGVSLSLHVDPAVSHTVDGDADRLRQVLANLIGNALKFTPPEGAVSVSASPGAQPDAVRFSVRDTGIGISVEAIERIFKPFSQADGSTTRNFGGTGLGLSICAELVELMHGTIGVESTLGKGSSFWFEVSLRRDSQALPKDKAVALPQASNGAGKARAEHILLVEDNPVNMLLAVKQFKLLGFDVTCVANGRESLDAVAERAFDLVFMDCHMPVMDGFEATKAIRKRETASTGHVPIVAMTADARIEDHALCISAGMDDYLSKPASLDDLRSIVARWLP